MDSWVLSLVESVSFIGLFFLVLRFLIPKAIRSFHKWQASQKDDDLTQFIGFVITSFFLISGLFVVFIRAFIRH